MKTKTDWQDKKKLLKKAGWHYVGSPYLFGVEVWYAPNGQPYTRRELDKIPIVVYPQLIWEVGDQPKNT